MRHADGDLAHAARSGRSYDGLQRRDRDLAAFQPEALGADIAPLAERLETLGLGELAQDRALLVPGQPPRPGSALDAPLDPRFLPWVLDMHELDADRPAVARLHDGHDLADGRRLEAEHVVYEDRAVEIRVGEAVGSWVELRMRPRDLQAERVELGLQMAAHAVGADQHERPQAVERRRPHLLDRRSDRGKSRRLTVRLGCQNRLVSTEAARRPGGP